MIWGKMITQDPINSNFQTFCQKLRKLSQSGFAGNEQSVDTPTNGGV